MSVVLRMTTCARVGVVVLCAEPLETTESNVSEILSTMTVMRFILDPRFEFVKDSLDRKPLNRLEAGYDLECAGLTALWISSPS
jgi:hypothetical protein